MRQITRVSELRSQVQEWRASGQRVALVPTMGNLHEGHLELMRLAQQHAARVICSIFVNPTQFGPGEDFADYPRTPEHDLRLLQAQGVDVVFCPGVEEVYPLGAAHATQVVVPALMDQLCGAARPGHFHGVATVVLRLLCMVNPDVAIFGLKDYQQQLIIRRLVADFNIPTEIVSAPTSRDADGLARSSRNQYLTPAQRQIAPALYATLQQLAARVCNGETRAEALCAEARQRLEDVGMTPEYVELRHAETLVPAQPGQRPLVALAAARLGRARLIDNLLIP